MVRMMDKRLTRQNWIDHGLRTLAAHGPTSLRVGALAEALGVSRGSFYWHFGDFADFRLAMLHDWRDRTVDQIVREFDADKGSPHRLKRLVRRAFFGKRGLESAIRIWAADEPAVAAMVAEVDASRVGYMAKLLIDAGVAAAQAQPRAAFIYWAYLGQAIVMHPASAAIDESALDTIAGILES